MVDQKSRMLRSQIPNARSQIPNAEVPNPEWGPKSRMLRSQIPNAEVLNPEWGTKSRMLRFQIPNGLLNPEWSYRNPEMEACKAGKSRIVKVAVFRHQFATLFVGNLMPVIGNYTEKDATVALFHDLRCRSKLSDQSSKLPSKTLRIEVFHS